MPLLFRAFRNECIIVTTALINEYLRIDPPRLANCLSSNHDSLRRRTISADNMLQEETGSVPKSRECGSCGTDLPTGVWDRQLATLVVSVL